MDNESKTIISPTVVDPDTIEGMPSVESSQRADLVRDEGGRPIRSPKSDLPKKFGYYFGENALADLALKMDAPPERQQEILRDYAKKVVEAVFKEVRCPESTGVLLNLDYPTDMSVLKGQLLGLMGSLEDMGELAGLEREDFELCKNLIERIRNEIIRLVEQGLDEKGIDRKVGVKGIKFGEGGIGKVFACRLGSENVAAKLIKEGVDVQLSYHRYPELIEATKSSDHLIKFFGSLAFKGEEAARLDFFEELNGAVSLDQYLDRKSSGLSEGASGVEWRGLTKFLSKIFVPVLKGLGAMHDRNLVHRDIKDANILITESGEGLDVKLGDYDLVVRSGEGGGDFSIGTIGWMSPEQAEGKDVNQRSDIYSMGMLLYYSLGGPKPNGWLDYLKWTQKPNHDFSISALKCPYPLKLLISSCLMYDPEKRPSAEEMVAEIGRLLQDPLFEAEIKAHLPENRPTRPGDQTQKMKRAA